MITKEKHREYVQRYRKKYPEKYRKQNQLDTQRRKNAELTAKLKAQDILLDELTQKLKKAEHDADFYSVKNQQLQHLYNKIWEYLKFSLCGNVPRVDVILLGLDFIYKSADLQTTERKYTENEN